MKKKKKKKIHCLILHVQPFTSNLCIAFKTKIIFFNAAGTLRSRLAPEISFSESETKGDEVMFIRGVTML